MVESRNPDTHATEVPQREAEAVEQLSDTDFTVRVTAARTPTATAEATPVDRSGRAEERGEPVGRAQQAARAVENHALLFGIGCAVLYWVLAAAWGPGQGTFAQRLLLPKVGDTSLRLLASVLFVALGWLLRRAVRGLKTAENELGESERRLETVTEAASEWVWEVDAGGQYTYVSPFVEKLLGYPPDEVLGKSMYELFHPEDREDLRQSAADLMRHRRPLTEFMNRKIGPSGAAVWLSTNAVPLLGSDGELVGYRGVDRDITDRIRTEERFKYVSFHDSLTGLLNRACFEDEMARYNREFREWKPFNVVLVDIDGLKVVNDTFGHKAGDELLRAAGELIAACFRHNDIVARIGGDEFCVLLPGLDPGIAESKKAEIGRRVKSYNARRPAMPMSLSVGTASSSGIETETAYDVLRRADDEMYEMKLKQKKSPRNKVIDLLLAASSDRDFVSEGRVERLTTMARALANTIDLPDDTRRNLLLLVRVHDMGMVGIPDDILFKSTTLTDEEYDVVKAHTLIGYNIASRSKDLTPMADLIRHHHERWDGRGYPDGLAGEHIPRECRMLAILDAYDAMTTARPYSTRLARDEAIAELRRCAGTQFDPGMVEAFVEAIT